MRSLEAPPAQLKPWSSNRTKTLRNPGPSTFGQAALGVEHLVLGSAVQFPPGARCSVTVRIAAVVTVVSFSRLSLQRKSPRPLAAARAVVASCAVVPTHRDNGRPARGGEGPARPSASHERSQVITIARQVPSGYLLKYPARRLPSTAVQRSAVCARWRRHVEATGETER